MVDNVTSTNFINPSKASNSYETHYTNDVSFESPVMTAKKKLTHYFYNAMLNHIVKEWNSYSDDTVDSIPSGDEVIVTKPYNESRVVFHKPINTKICEEEMLIPLPKSDSSFMLGRTSRSVNKRSSIYLREKKKGEMRQKKSSTLYLDKKTKKLSRKKSKGPKSDSKLYTELEKNNDFRTIMLSNIKKEDAEVLFLNGNRYMGEMQGKMMHGKGRYMWTDGTTYVGDFKNGQITGTGRIEYSDKTVYEGTFYKGYVHGYGTQFLGYSESYYSGEWYAGHKHGEGMIVFRPNDYYRGMWKNNVREGKGMRNYFSNVQYLGDWHYGLRHGIGTATHKNGDFYHGNWMNGQKSGYGEYVWNAFLNNFLSIPVQNKYCGMWEQDCMHGFGLLYFGTEGGGRYAGTFYQNVKHGAGILVCDNGSVVRGDPLFVNDKPVQALAKGKYSRKSKDIDTSRNQTGMNNRNAPFDVAAAEDLEFKTINDYVTNAHLPLQIYPIKSTHTLKEKNYATPEFNFPCFGLEKNRIASVNQVKDLFVEWPASTYVPLKIELKSKECVDLTKIIDIVVDKYFNHVVNNYDNKENINYLKSNYFKDIKVWPKLLSENFYERFIFKRCVLNDDVNNFREMEHERIHKAIRFYFPRLTDLYDHYSFVTCFYEKPDYKPWLMRIFLWQLYTDCEIPLKHVISLCEIDRMMADYNEIQVNDIHNPFDVIYFYQFLLSLLSIAWRLYGEEIIKTFFSAGVLEKAFIKFMETDIIPYAKQHKGSALFEYLNVVPITAMYNWYKSFGEPITAEEFLKYSNSLYNTAPPIYFRNRDFKVPIVKFGENVSFVSDKIVFRDVLSFVIGNKKFNHAETPALSHDYYVKSLKFLYTVGPRKILSILNEICPWITVENEPINLNKKITFLDFFEIILKCTEAKVKMDKRIKNHFISHHKNNNNNNIHFEGKHHPKLRNRTHSKQFRVLGSKIRLVPMNLSQLF